MIRADDPNALKGKVIETGTRRSSHSLTTWQRVEDENGNSEQQILTEEHR